MGDQDDGIDGLACPECGGDVSTLEDIHRNRTHRSRLLPLIAWGLVCLGLIVYWVLNGTYGSKISPGKYTDDAVFQTYWNQISLTPDSAIRSAKNVPYVSVKNLHNGINGDDDALDRVAEKLLEAQKYNQDPGKTYGSVLRVQFGWYEPYGTMGSSNQYSFGRSILVFEEDIILQDIRDEESLDYDSNRSWGTDGWRFWPRVGHEKHTSQGSVFRSWYVSWVGAFQMVSVCLVGAWLTGLIYRFIGASKKNQARFKLSAFFLFFIIACILTVIFAQHNTYVRGENSQYIQSQRGQGGLLSGEFTLEDLDEAAADEIKLVLFCQELLDILPEGYDDELLLAQGWQFSTQLTESVLPSNRFTRISIGNFLGWIHFYQYRFEHVDDAYKIEALHGKPWLAQLIQDGDFNLRWGAIESQSILSFNLIGWISIGVIFWMIWASLQAIARFIFRRVQKRRVAQKQCVFCTYPLTQAGMQARYPEVES